MGLFYPPHSLKQRCSNRIGAEAYAGCGTLCAYGIYGRLIRVRNTGFVGPAYGICNLKKSRKYIEKNQKRYYISRINYRTPCCSASVNPSKIYVVSLRRGPFNYLFIFSKLITSRLIVVFFLHTKPHTNY